MSEAFVLQVNTSPGGLPKTPIFYGDVDTAGIAGDDHRNKKYHGGPKKALLLIAAEAIDELVAAGWPLFYGALGENLTTRGLDRRAWRSGQRYRIGSTLLIELTTPRMPCKNLHRYGELLGARIYDARVKANDPDTVRWGLSGFYASVLTPGLVKPHDRIERISS